MDTAIYSYRLWRLVIIEPAKVNMCVCLICSDNNKAFWQLSIKKYPFNEAASQYLTHNATESLQVLAQQGLRIESHGKGSFRLICGDVAVNVDDMAQMEWIYSNNVRYLQ